MANPKAEFLPVDTWVKVADNVISGSIKKLDNSPAKYLETYRMHNGIAPATIEEGVPVFLNSNHETIGSSAGIDVYMMARGNDGVVRVDV